MRRRLRYLNFVMLFILTGCASQRVSTIVGCDYNKSKNQTDYFELPFGSVSIPGKWEQTHYNKVSGQQFFMNSDSIGIAIAFNRFDKYEFNGSGAKKGYDFVKAFYEWESNYFVDSYGFHSKIIETDSLNNYILFQIYGSSNGINIDTYFLFGEHNGNVSNLSIFITDKWKEDDKIKFLKGLFLEPKDS